MRKIEPTTAFKRDFKREGKGPHRSVLDTDLKQVITALANDVQLQAKHRDHPLTGNWKDYRDCHVRPDLVLIYRLIDVALIRSWISEYRWPWPSTTPHFRLNRRVAPLAVAVAARWCLSQLGHPLTGDRAL